MCTVLLPPGVNPIAVNKYKIHSTTFKYLVGHVERLEECIFTFWLNNTNTFRTCRFHHCSHWNVDIWKLTFKYNTKLKICKACGLLDATHRFKIQQDRQCTCNVTLRRVVQPLLQWKSCKYYIFWVCVCSLRYPTSNSHVPSCHLWPARLYSIFPHSS